MITEKDDIRLIDFGFATQDNEQKIKKYVGDPSYVAPEVFEGLTTT